MGEFYPAGSQNKKLLIFELNTTSDQYGLLQTLPIEVPQLREVAITQDHAYIIICGYNTKTKIFGYNGSLFSFLEEKTEANNSLFSCDINDKFIVS